MRTIEEIKKQINSGKKCKKDCFSHKFIIHNFCVLCKAFKDSPYHQEFLKDKTDKEIAFEIQEFEKGLDDD